MPVPVFTIAPSRDIYVLALDGVEIDRGTLVHCECARNERIHALIHGELRADDFRARLAAGANTAAGAEILRRRFQVSTVREIRRGVRFTSGGLRSSV